MFCHGVSKLKVFFVPIVLYSHDKVYVFYINYYSCSGGSLLIRQAKVSSSVHSPESQSKIKAKLCLSNCHVLNIRQVQRVHVYSDMVHCTKRRLMVAEGRLEVAGTR